MESFLSTLTLAAVAYHDCFARSYASDMHVTVVM